MSRANQYEIKKERIVFGTKKLKDVDVETFKILPNGFAKDKNRLFYNGKDTELDLNSLQFCDDYYIKDEATVCQILPTKLKKFNADPSTFQALGSNFAKDKDRHFYNGKRIAVKDRASFEVIQDDFAIDKQCLYYQNEKIKVQHKQKAKDVKLIHYSGDYDYTLVTIGRVVVLQDYWLRIVEGADPDSIKFITCAYLVDDDYFYYENDAFVKNRGQKITTLEGTYDVLILNDTVYAVGEELKNADGNKLLVFDDFYCDKNRIYRRVSYKHDVNILPLTPLTEKSISPEETRQSIHRILQLMFYIYDYFPPMTEFEDNHIDELAEKYQSLEMPAFEIRMNGDEVHINYNNQLISGKISAFLFFSADVWSVIREMRVDNRPLRRLLYDNHDYADGYYLIKIVQEIVGEELLKVALYFFYNHQKDEALLIVEKLFHEIEFRHKYRIAVFRQCPYEVLAQTPFISDYEKWIGRGSSKVTTNLARAKEILPFLKDKDLYQRLQYAKEMFGLITATGNIDGFYKPVFLPLLEITREEKVQHIREILFECIDLAVTIYFRHLEMAGPQYKQRFYPKVGPIVKFLLESGINTDLNTARFWECTHLTSENEVKEAMQSLQKYIDMDIIAPAMWWTAYSYPNFKAWMVDASLRLAYLKTKEQAKEIVDKAYKELNEMRFLYNAYVASEAFAAMQINIVNLCQEISIAPPFDDYTDRSSNSGYGWVYDTVNKCKFVVFNGQVLQHGKYKAKKYNPHYNLLLEKEGIGQTVKLGDCIGVDYIIEGQPWGRRLKTTITVHHPKSVNGKTVSRFTDCSMIGVKSSFYWCFEKEKELQAGKWKIKISFPEHKDKKLAAMKFEVDFDLRV